MVGVISIIMLPTTKTELLPDWEDQLPQASQPETATSPAGKN